MTESILISLIVCVCGHITMSTPNVETRIACYEDYVNCAVGKGGKVLTEKEFVKKCNLRPNQNKCLR